MTDNELIKELSDMAFIMERLGDLRKAKIIKNAVALIGRRTAERDEARRDCAVAENNHASAVAENFALPCTIGDAVWAIRDYKGTKIAQPGIVSEMFFVGEKMDLCIVVKHIARGRWGETIFATKEEADDKL